MTLKEILENFKKENDIKSLEVHPSRSEKEKEIFSSLLQKLKNCGNLSEKQIDLLKKFQCQYICEFCGEKHHEKECEKIPAIENGRYDIVGKMVCVRTKDTNWGLSYKCLIVGDNGQKFWGSVPKQLHIERDLNKKFRLRATVERSSNDPKFGFYKRPSKLELL